MLLAARLLAQRTSVCTFGLGQDAPTPVSSLFEALSGADAVVLPLPLTRDGLHPCMPACEDGAPPTFARIFSRAEEETLFLGGCVPVTVAQAAEEAGVTLLDYAAGERFLWKNARATAEAAIAMAIEALPCTLDGCPVTVVGYGRIAQMLLPLLRAMGAEVTLAARGEAARAAAEALGYSVLCLREGESLSLPSHVRAVFHTAPAPLFSAEAIERLPHGCLLLDLAGGCCDTAAAERCGVLCPSARGLPGRFSPESAGHYICEEILSLIETKRGVHI